MKKSYLWRKMTSGLMAAAVTVTAMPGLGLTMVQAEEKKTLKVAMECSYAPYNWTQPDDSNGAVPISGSSVKNAVKGYREINLRAMKLVKDGGFLATCSCSHFMDYQLFTQTIGQAARNVHKRLRQVEYRTQAPDHPILWSADESYYLKFYIFQVCSDR